jgi:hypothetical protein
VVVVVVGVGVPAHPVALGWCSTCTTIPSGPST